MSPEAATKVTELAESLKACADALEHEDWESLHESAEETARLARWLQLDEQDQ